MTVVAGDWQGSASQEYDTFYLKSPVLVKKREGLLCECKWCLLLFHKILRADVRCYYQISMHTYTHTSLHYVFVSKSKTYLLQACIFSASKFVEPDENKSHPEVKDFIIDGFGLQRQELTFWSCGRSGWTGKSGSPFIYHVTYPLFMAYLGALGTQCLPVCAKYVFLAD